MKAKRELWQYSKQIQDELWKIEQLVNTLNAASPAHLDRETAIECMEVLFKRRKYLKETGA
jgi:uncharacterized membrane protein